MNHTGDTLSVVFLVLLLAFLLLWGKPDISDFLWLKVCKWSGHEQCDMKGRIDD